MHAHAATWKERGLLPAQNCPTEHGPETLGLWGVVRLPEQVAVMHGKDHQKGMSPVSRGNGRAGREAKKAALGPDKQMALFSSVSGSDIKADYTSEEISWALEQGGVHEGPWIYTSQRVFLPQASQCKFFFNIYIFYLFIFRDRGREGERERNINVWLTLVRPLVGT